MITDILGRPAKIGDTIITKGYGTATLDHITAIDEITKSGIKCKVGILYSKYDTTFKQVDKSNKQRKL